MNSNLIPEQRVDKNGRTTKRWVKPNAAGGTDKTQLPAPKAAAPLKTPSLDAAFRRANLDSQGLTNADLDPRTAIAVEELLERSRYFTAAVKTGVNDMVFAALKEIRDDYSDEPAQTQINNVAVFGETLMESNFVMDRMFMYVNGLHKNGLYTQIDDFLLDATDEQREEAKALLKFVNSAPEPWSTHYYGYDETDPEDSVEDHTEDDEDEYCIRIGGKEPQRLAQLIIDHRDQVDEIIAIVNERGDADVDMLDNIIGHNAQSLRQGLL